MGESVNEMFITPAITSTAGGIVGLLASIPTRFAAAPVTVPGGIAVGYKGGQAVGAYRLADRVYNQSLIEYQNNLLAENRRRYLNNEEMISYDGADATAYAARAVAVEGMMELTTRRIPFLSESKKVAAAGKGAMKGSAKEGVKDFTNAELSALRGGAKQHVRKFATNTLRQSGQSRLKKARGSVTISGQSCRLLLATS